MYELLKFVESEMESSSSDWYDECNSFLTLFFSTFIDGLFPFSVFGGGSDV